MLSGRAPLDSIVRHYLRNILMKIAAYQAPLLPGGSIDAALGLIREQVDRCESAGIEILCCPEGVLGGLADYATRPTAIAINVEDGQLNTVLAPLASEI